MDLFANFANEFNNKVFQNGKLLPGKPKEKLRINYKDI